MKDETMTGTLARITDIRNEIADAERRLYDAMIEDVPIGTRIVFTERGDELIGEVVEHSKEAVFGDGLAFIVVRDGETYVVYLKNVLDIA